MRAGIRIFDKEVRFSNSKFGFRYKCYESNIEPFLRLMHIRDVQPCGWIQIQPGFYEVNRDILPTTCQIDITCDWTAIRPVHMEKSAPMVIASFDLECTSSHGDFPVATKDYKKVANELFQAFRNFTPTDEEEKLPIIPEIVLAFDHTTKGRLSKVYSKAPLRMSTDTLLKYEEMLEFILQGRIIYDEEENKYVNIGNKKATESKEEIIRTLTKRLSDILPPLHGDPIIQIGTTVHAYGEKECSFRHIVTLKSCDPIEGVTVESCETEAELLLKWRDMVVALDPDVMIGYNIFGFDMAYLYERAKELGIADAFMKIGRIAHTPSQYREKTLSSSALGDNLLKFIDMEGRVVIDIMKVVQRDHKLDSYKLDNVANHFMKLNKHDVSPNDIFRLQKGTSADRKVIAEYCIQDCALCNKLMMKLEILANNIGMSNVCNVPLMYIFMRGQGIKIFSLVAKQCREDQFCIPSLAKPYRKPGEPEEEEDAEDSFEGAIVLEPKTGIYLEDPVSVLDYASLYPSSMISENLSQDCIVLDPKYGDIPGAEYLEITYDVYEGTGDKKVKVDEKTCKFYQGYKDAEGKFHECKGMMPRILMKLLKARKDTRKKIEYETVTTATGDEYTGLIKEEGDNLNVWRIDGSSDVVPKDQVVSRVDTYDEFQRAVLDGLQLAYKVTANSLYGSCGAKTSPIYMKEIAACTTATGRKMILKAKQWMLDNYPGIKIAYGDSVTGDTPLLTRFPDGSIDIITIETLVDETTWTSYENFKPFDTGRSGKQQSFLEAEVWTDGKWAKINRVIRHYTNKKLYRVNTFRGSVDVTEDHSLIGADGNPIKPGDTVVNEGSYSDMTPTGTNIMHSFPEQFPENDIQLKAYTCDKFYKQPEVIEEERTCTCCKETKPGTEFYATKITNKKTQKVTYRYTKHCRVCAQKTYAEKKGKVYDTSKFKKKVLNFNVPEKCVTKEEAWVMGFFFGDGSCGDYMCKSGRKRSWAINNSNTDYLNRARDYLLQVEPSSVVSDFKILNTIKSSGVYKLAPTGSFVYMVEKYRALFYDKDDFKKVPKLILNAQLEVRQWFIEGYLTADGAKKQMHNGDVFFACLGKIGAQGLYYLCKSCGWSNLRVNIQAYKDNTYWISNIKTDRYYETFKDQVMKMEEIGDVTESTYVYDIETESGRFHAGVGEIVLKNTDSVQVCMPIRTPEEIANNTQLSHKEKIRRAWDMGMEASKNFKKLLKPPHDLEMEKVMFPFILFSKKRYCAYKYEGPDAKPKLNSMGIVLKRRDNANIVKKVYGGIIDIIMNEHNINKSVEFLKTNLTDLIEGKYPMEDLIITKSLKADYKDPEKIAHKVLADRMGERDEGTRPQVNDRIPFVYIQPTEKIPKGKKLLQGERIEHPDYIRQNKLKPDYEFYITNQLMTPICQLYALALDDLKGYKKSPEYWRELEQKLIKEKNGDMKKARERLADLKETEAKTILFDPILTKLSNKKNGNQEITKWFAKLEKQDDAFNPLNT